MPGNIHETLTDRPEKNRNLYASGKVFELRRVLRVDKLQNGVLLVGDAALTEAEETGTFSQTELPTLDLQPGDIIRLDQQGPSACRLTEVYREGLRIFPTRKARMIELIGHANFRKTLRSRVDTSVNRVPSA